MGRRRRAELGRLASLRNGADRLHLVTVARRAGAISRRSELNASQRSILAALHVAEPPRFPGFTPSQSSARRAEPGRGAR